MAYGLTRTFKSATLVCLIAAALLGCAETATAPEDRHVSAADLRFITGLYNIRAFDNRVIDAEVARQSDPRVVALARKIQAHVNSFYARVEPIAQRDGISPPGSVSLVQQSDMQMRIAALIGKGRYDFDLEFLDDEIAAHHDILDAARGALQEPAGDPALHALLVEAAGTLQSNLDGLNALRDVLKGEGR